MVDLCHWHVKYLITHGLYHHLLHLVNPRVDIGGTYQDQINPIWVNAPEITLKNCMLIPICRLRKQLVFNLWICMPIPDALLFIWVFSSCLCMSHLCPHLEWEHVAVYHIRREWTGVFNWPDKEIHHWSKHVVWTVWKDKPNSRPCVKVLLLSRPTAREKRLLRATI